ncbi:MAG: HD domain-containing protein [Spirochaetaceae bacterium]|nr:MAG: HD domain-containing protein [Spirochaetaceae bacterium]
MDDDEPMPRFGFGVLDFLFDPRADVFLDRADAYQELRGGTVSARQTGEPGSLYEAAVLAARYDLTVPEPESPLHSTETSGIKDAGATADIPTELQRRLFIDLLTGDHGERGLALLMNSGAVARLWPELEPMNDTGHSKEHHPEGNVWEHTLETLRYRKTRNLTLAAALLLHDSGKPYSERTRERAFDKHAEIGARTAARLLRRLGFSAGFVSDVEWLIQNHMLPGALHRLPTYRSERAMASPLFPLLLELYRCDLCSTYRGPDGYYRACTVYRSFLKNRANPFRSTDGKKLLRLYVE